MTGPGTRDVNEALAAQDRPTVKVPAFAQYPAAPGGPRVPIVGDPDVEREHDLIEMWEADYL